MYGILPIASLRCPVRYLRGRTRYERRLTDVTIMTDLNAAGDVGIIGATSMVIGGWPLFAWRRPMLSSDIDHGARAVGHPSARHGFGESDL
jgi:hypothetical protein